MLLNARSNSAADLSGGDFKTVIGFQAHGQSNQQWEFCTKGNGYTIRSLRLPSGYLTVEGEAKENAVVVATASGRRTERNVEQTSEGLRYVIFGLHSTWREGCSELSLLANVGRGHRMPGYCGRSQTLHARSQTACQARRCV